MKIYIIILSSIILFSCSKHKDSFIEWRIKEVSNSYKEQLNSINFPKETLNHFPDSIERLPVKWYTSFSDKYNYMYFMLFKYDIDTYDQAVSQRYIAKYQSSNDSLLAIRQFRRNSFGKGFKSYRHIDMESAFYPILFFEKHDYDSPEDVVKTADIYSDDTICGLSENFSIYVIDSKSGVYMDELNPLDYMPKDWKMVSLREYALMKKIVL